MENRELIELTQSMIRIASPYYQEEALLDFCEGWLKEHGLAVQRHRFTEDKITHYSGSNLICTLEGLPGGPTILLNGHLDSVPLCEGWTKDPFGADIEGDRLYGLGSADMKAGCAALMLAFANLARQRRAFRGRLILTLVCDEEGPWGLGCDALLSSGLLPEKVDFILSTEPSAAFCRVDDVPVICTGAKGNYVMTAEFFGKSAHASQPERGINAAVEAGRFLAAIEQPTREGLLGRGAFCVLKIEADGGACSVPDRAKVTWTRHLNELETLEEITAEAEHFMKKGGVSCPYSIALRPYPTETSRGYPPYAVEPDNEWIHRLAEAVQAASGKAPKLLPFDSIGDFNYLAVRLKAPCLIYGPAGGQCHGTDEFVSVSSLCEVERGIETFLQSAL
ncbi:MAG: M20 family metallopeptidase [Ruminococcaceae bacterium]|nr:M20 family metallopeptidase [Oscillospiraceae bacterium]